MVRPRRSVAQSHRRDGRPALDEDRGGSERKRPASDGGQLCKCQHSMARYPGIAERQMDILHTVTRSRSHVGLRSVDRDDRLNAQLSQRRESRFAVRTTSAVDARTRRRKRFCRPGASTRFISSASFTGRPFGLLVLDWHPANTIKSGKKGHGGIPIRKRFLREFI